MQRKRQEKSKEKRGSLAAHGGARIANRSLSEKNYRSSDGGPRNCGCFALADFAHMD
jgi:hypothetical protein